MTRELILNAFHPNAEIDDPRFFAGRKKQILALTDALLTRKACPVIFGSRGIGKTSLALQVARIALGDVTLFHEFGCSERALKPNQRWTVFWVNCSAKTTDTESVFQRVINSAYCYTNLKDIEEMRLMSSDKKKRLKFKFYESESLKHFEATQLDNYSEFDVEERLLHTVDHLFNSGHQRILFIIDEIDRVEATQGLADFLKSESTSSLKFLLVGIGNSVSSLLAGHKSLERALVQIRVKPMDEDELKDIINKATRNLLKNSISVTFSPAAQNRLVQTAGGLPWFVHVLAQEAMTAVWDRGLTEIAETDIQAAMHSIAENKFAQSLSDQYQAAVRDSPPREVLLRLFAKWPLDDIPTSDIYPIAKSIGVSNPSAYRKHLLRARYGAVLCTPPQHERGIVRFNNAIFKRYVDICDGLFQDVKETVDAAWDAAVAQSQSQ